MRYSRRKREPGRIKTRILVVGVFISLLYVIVAGRVVQLQVFRGDMLADKASGQYMRTYVTSGKRGTIYDRNRMELAVTVDAASIGLHPAQATGVDEVASKLAKALHMEPKVIRRKLASREPFVWIKRMVAADELEAVKQINLPARAVAFIPEQKRVYPNNSLASQLIGFTGIDGHGLEGIEFAWDEYLKGDSISRTVLMDARQRSLGAGEGTAPTPDGNDVLLTIDGAIQYITETALEEAVVDAGAESGMAVVMDPNTGEVLAMANYPSFDLNEFGRYSRTHWRNRVVADAFEPGSVMKVFLAAGSIESGLCTPDSVFFCEEGKYRIRNHFVHDTNPYGWLTLREIIKYSSNIGAVKVSEKIGRKNLWETLRRFGFDSRPDIQCPGSANGMLAYYGNWTDVDAGAIAFGHGVSASAIQLVTAVSAIANGGLLVKPYVVSAVIDRDGQVVRHQSREIVRRVISEPTALYLKDMMAGVTDEGGTGKEAAIDGYTVCGKTGTAQKVTEQGRYADKDYISSFLGFAPGGNPRVAALVVINSPRKRHYGGLVAAPAFRRIVHEALNYFGVPPERNTTGEDLMVQVRQGVSG